MLQSQSGPAEQSVLLSKEEVSSLRYVPAHTPPPAPLSSVAFREEDAFFLSPILPTCFPSAQKLVSAGWGFFSVFQAGVDNRASRCPQCSDVTVLSGGTCKACAFHTVPGAAGVCAWWLVQSQFQRGITHKATAKPDMLPSAG